MEYKVDGWNNFCRVFQVPNEYPEGYLHNGGKNVNFLMVDWFNPLGLEGQPAVTKDVWLKEVGDYETVLISHKDLQEKLIDFLKNKVYVNDNCKYLFMADFGASFMFDKNGIL